MSVLYYNAELVVYAIIAMSFAMNLLNKNILVLAKTVSASNPVTAILFISLFFGEPGVLFLSFLSAQHFFPITLVVVISYVSAFIGEIFWFLIGRSKFFHAIENLIVRSGISEAFSKFTKHINIERPFKTLLLARFISGLTIPIIVYLSRKNTRLSTFIKNCLIVNVIWTPIIALIGWLAGKGFVFILDAFQSVELALSALIVAVIIWFVVKKRLKSSIND